MTYISKLIVGGFKSIRERTEIPIAPLTFLFGPNSAGKSAVLGALRSLRERISERFDAKKRESVRLYGPSFYRDGMGHSRPLNRPEAQESEEPLLHLGVCLEEFSVENSYIHDLAIDFHDSAVAFLGALDGASVEIEVIESVWRSDYLLHMATESSLMVDGVRLFYFIPRGCADVSVLPPEMITDSPNDDQCSLGAVLVNLNHHFWEMLEIPEKKEKWADLDVRVMSSFDRKKFVSLLNGIKDKISRTNSHFLNKFIIANALYLKIRVNVDFLSADKWDFSSAYEPWGRVGYGYFSEDEISIIKDINEIITVVSDMGVMILNGAFDYLNVDSVDGDRKILSIEDVTVDLPFDKKDMVIENYWKKSWVAWSIKEDSTRRIYEDYIKMYAHWLGLRCAGSDYLNDDDFKSILDRKDFVNEILNDYLFGASGYKVKPAMWLTTKKIKTLLHRERVDDDEYESELEERSFKVQLYLEDRNGRCRHFHEVGSGVSYVMPILASLHAAKTSWIAQPELHLHPAAQCEMGDVFLRAFNRGHFSVVETHSEHLLLRVLKRIRQTTRGVEMDDDLKCAPEAVSVLYFDPQEDGSTEIKQMRVSRLGDFKDRWPHGFFEERGQELFDE